MSTSGIMQVEMTFDPTPTNGPTSAFSALSHAPDMGAEDDQMNDHFAIPEDEDDEQIQVRIEFS